MKDRQPRILVIEDEPITREQLQAHLESESFEVWTLPDAVQAARTIGEREIDICLIDINLPGKDGLSLTRELRETSNLGVILVTGRSQLIDRLTGLESGADDYVTKPFEPRELVSRVRNLYRRLGKTHSQAIKEIRFAGWVLDVNRRQLTAPGAGQERLSAGEFNLLIALIDNRGAVLSRDQLMNRIRNREWFPDDRYIDVLVGQVRRKFRNHDPETTFISTVHGAGYVFVPALL